MSNKICMLINRMQHRYVYEGITVYIKFNLSIYIINEIHCFFFTCRKYKSKEKHGDLEAEAKF